MTVSRLSTLMVVVAACSALAGQAQAFTARQATAQGQGQFVTSSGAAQNLMTAGPTAEDGSRPDKRPLRAAHHDRYFAGF